MTGQHWCEGSMVLFDLETDSPEPTDAHLVTAALVTIEPGREPGVARWLAAPSRPIPAQATEVHGISTEYATEHGAPRERVITELAALMFGAWDHSTPLLGHNICYDLTVLDREMGRELDRELICSGPVVDTLLLDKRCDRFRPGSRRLEDVCAHYGATVIGQAHDAATDALAAGRLAYKMAKRRAWPRGRYGPHATETAARQLVASGRLRALHSAQMAWHEEGQRGFAAYLRTDKAVAKIEERVASGETSRADGDVEIETRWQRADAIEACAAGGWPFAPRSVTSSV